MRTLRVRGLNRKIRSESGVIPADWQPDPDASKLLLTDRYAEYPVKIQPNNCFTGLDLSPIFVDAIFLHFTFILLCVNNVKKYVSLVHNVYN